MRVRNQLLLIEKILLVFVLLSALPKHAIYLSPFRSFGAVGYLHPASVVTKLLAMLFIICPLMAVYYHVRNRSARFFWLAAFAVPAFMFGVIPIPFAERLYTDNVEANTIAIAAVNFLYFIIVAYLYYLQRKYSSNVNAPKELMDK